MAQEETIGIRIKLYGSDQVVTSLGDMKKLLREATTELDKLTPGTKKFTELKDEISKELPVDDTVSGTVNVAPEAPKLTVESVTVIDKALDYITTSSRNPEEWSMTVKAFIVAQVPITIYFLKTVGIEVDSVLIGDIVNKFTLGLSLVMGTFGMLRKVYFWGKSFIETIKPLLTSK